jgi:hypothetical protein
MSHPNEALKRAGGGIGAVALTLNISVCAVVLDFDNAFAGFQIVELELRMHKYFRLRLFHSREADGSMAHDIESFVPGRF